MVVGNILLLVLAVGVVIVNVLTEWTRAVQRHESCNIIKAGWSEATHELAHLDTLELEDSKRVALLQHLKDFYVIKGNIVNVNEYSVATLDVLERALNNREVPESQEVHL